MKASYRRLCVHYHPDKHNPLNREAAEELFQKIKKAYDGKCFSSSSPDVSDFEQRKLKLSSNTCQPLFFSVLIDPKTRTIFDIYGVEGLESDWSVTLRSMNQNEVSNRVKNNPGCRLAWRQTLHMCKYEYAA